jgi:hypothetical protein
MFLGRDGNRRQWVFFCFVIIVYVHLRSSAVILWTEVCVYLCSTAAPFPLFAFSPPPLESAIGAERFRLSARGGELFLFCILPGIGRPAPCCPANAGPFSGPPFRMPLGRGVSCASLILFQLT